MTTIQKTLMIAAMAVAGASSAAFAANPAVTPLQVSNINIEQNESTLSVSMDLDPAGLNLASSREIIAYPVISDSLGNSVSLPAIYYAGRSRYYLHLREKDVKKPDTLVRATKASAINYSASVAYQPWMQLSNLNMAYDLRGCSCSELEHADIPVLELDLTPLSFTPSFVTVAPLASGVKTRELKGSAYVDFPVNRTELYPDYRRNPEELARIRESIDLVRNDPDATITSIFIKGYASPEGPYNNNVRLAKGRTQTLCDYVQGLYAFNPSIMKSDWEAEDWAGLRKYVENSDFPRRDAMLSLIDSNLAPDAKDNKLKSDFPTEYAYLLKNVYPALRHSDYTVEYVVRSFSDVNEIARILKTSPNKLSLNELMLLAKSLDPQSDEYADVFDTAVVMFPNDPVANLNAAVINMRRGYLDKAQNYLSRADGSNEAIYARGILQGLQGNYANAVATLQPIAQIMPEAADAMAQIQKIMNSPLK